MMQVILKALYHAYFVILLGLFADYLLTSVAKRPHSNSQAFAQKARAVSIELNLTVKGGGGLGFSAPDFKVNLLNVPKY